MAKRMRSWNQNKYEQYLKAGRGQGEGSVYLPWIRIQDFSSLGMVSRIYSNKTNRVHHFLSRNELRYFYLLEWSDKVLDIREQYPLLDMELATDVALKAGIKYPKDNISGFPYVLTCDFMITTSDGLKARTIKCTSELKNKRTLEKLEIERRYWQELGIDWRLVTEREIPVQKSKNIEWLHTSATIPEYLADKRLQEEILFQIENDIPVPQVIMSFDEQYALPKGSGLQLMKHLLWKRKFACEMDTELLESVCYRHTAGVSV
jgi:hypothetical protein